MSSPNIAPKSPSSTFPFAGAFFASGNCPTPAINSFSLTSRKRNRSSGALSSRAAFHLLCRHVQPEHRPQVAFQHLPLRGRFLRQRQLPDARDQLLLIDVPQAKQKLRRLVQPRGLPSALPPCPARTSPPSRLPAPSPSRALSSPAATARRPRSTPSH